jgi:hypothetical protein
MNRTHIVLAAVLPAAVGLAQEPVQPAKVSTLQELVSTIREREHAVKSVEMTIATEGALPDGSTFSTHGTLRILGKTHFHALMKAKFGDEFEGETETVKTPDGVTMREKDPIQGEVFVRMDPVLVRRLESASQHLGADAEIPGLSDRQADGPLGSSLLTDLDRQFDLAVRGPQVVDGQQCWVVGGPVRKGGDADDQLGFAADRVDVIVRCRDTAVIRMTQLLAGKKQVDVRIDDLRVDTPLEAESFKLGTAPRGAFTDVMAHPPASAQITRLLQEAESKGWVDPTAPAPTRDEATPPPQPDKEGKK